MENKQKPIMSIMKNTVNSRPGAEYIAPAAEVEASGLQDVLCVSGSTEGYTQITIPWDD